MGVKLPCITLGAGKGSRPTGSGLSLARIALRVPICGDWGIAVVVDGVIKRFYQSGGFVFR